MKHNFILHLLIIVFLSNCTKDDCNKSCNGFDKDLIEYRFSPFQSEKETLLYTNQDNTNTLELNLKSDRISEERFIEQECDSFANILWGGTTESCDEYFSATYAYTYNSMTTNFSISLSKKEDQIENINYILSFNDHRVDFIFENEMIKIDEESEYSVEILDDVLIITNNSLEYREDMIEKVWIKKNIGLIKIELDNQIWEYDYN